MKYFFSLALLSSALLLTTSINAQQDKSKRPSPPAKVSEKIKSGATISIDYSQPSLKGRTIGTTVEPKKDEVWRMGANEATVFEVNKDVTINGKALKAGKYGLFSIWNGDTWTVIFNKTWNQWGAFNYKEGDDVLRVNVKNMPPASSSEKMTFTVDDSGKVTLTWGNIGFDFMVK